MLSIHPKKEWVISKFFLAGLFLVAISAFFLFGRNNILGTMPAVSGGVRVTVNDEIFLPDRITIALGTKVTWINEGEHTHWPASNPHPVHTGYPVEGGCIGSVLDACRGLQSNENFSFVFDKIGRFPMHDHLYPGITMEVVVVPAGTSVEKNITTSSPALVTDPVAFRVLNYYDQGKQIAIMAEKDPQTAWNFLKSVFIIKGVVSGNVHEFAHKIGNAAYAKYGFDGVKICDAVFAFGCFHGVTEKMLQSEGPSTVKKIESTCLVAFPPEISQDYTGCIHGAGHGLYSWYGGALTKALRDCDVLGTAYRTYCYDGVFMENSFHANASEITEVNAWDFCKSVSDVYQYNCARYQAFIFTDKYGKDYNKVDALCSHAPNGTLLNTCFMSLGFIITQSALGDLQEITSACDSLSSLVAKSQCYVGASLETKFQKYQNWEVNSPKLCELVDRSVRTVCQ